MTKRRRSRQLPGPVELVLLPDVPAPAEEPPVPSPYDHLHALQQRVSIAGKRRVPGLGGLPAGVRRVKIPSGFNGDGSVMWREM